MIGLFAVSRQLAFGVRAQHFSKSNRHDHEEEHCKDKGDSGHAVSRENRTACQLTEEKKRTGRKRNDASRNKHPGGDQEDETLRKQAPAERELSFQEFLDRGPVLTPSEYEEDQILKNGIILLNDPLLG